LELLSLHISLEQSFISIFWETTWDLRTAYRQKYWGNLPYYIASCDLRRYYKTKHQAGKCCSRCWQLGKTRSKKKYTKFTVKNGIWVYV